MRQISIVRNSNPMEPNWQSHTALTTLTSRRLMYWRMKLFGLGKSALHREYDIHQTALTIFQFLEFKIFWSHLVYGTLRFPTSPTWDDDGNENRPFSWADGTEVMAYWDPTADYMRGWRTEHSYVILDPKGMVTAEDHMCTFQKRNRVWFV